MVAISDKASGGVQSVSIDAIIERLRPDAEEIESSKSKFGGDSTNVDPNSRAKRTKSTRFKTAFDATLSQVFRKLIRGSLSTTGADCFWAIFNQYCLLIESTGQIRDCFQNDFGSNAVLQDEFVGPMAHQFALGKNRMVLLAGEDHSLAILKDYVEVSAPLFNGQKQLVGALTIFLPARRLADHAETLRLWMGLLASAAENVELSYAELASTKRIKGAEDLAANLLGYIDDGIVLVNEAGIIRRANKVASMALGIDQSDASTLPLYRYMPQEASLLAEICRGSILNGKQAQIETARGRQSCSISSRPLSSTDESLASIVRIRHLTNSEANLAELQSIKEDTFDGIAGRNPKLLKTLDQAKFFASTKASVLIIGSTGTGKSQLAHAIHNAATPNAPFISINCGALQKGEATRLLFGSDEDGRQSIGLFEYASGGTLYLDEVCDLSPENQALFLALNDGGWFARVGSSERQRANFRIIASSTRSLNNRLAAGAFRADLYYRLAVVKLELPDVKDRMDDVPLLARSIVARYCESRNIPSIAISGDALHALVSYSWPGNVRQLRTAINYACDQCKNRTVALADLPVDIIAELDETVAASQELESIEETKRRQIVIALRRANGNVTEAANLLGVGRSTLYKMIKRYDIPRRNCDDMLG